MNALLDKHILLGVTGGIAAYKTPDLVRRLREAGAEVRVVLTDAAAAFVTPLTLQAVSGRPVHQALLSAEAESGMGHIELARWADLVLIAPATADFMARLAHGFADDLLTACCRATRAPVAIAPAMNVGMWQNAATQRNLRQLTDDGVRVFGPASGSQACGEVGEGRMLEPLELVAACAAQFGGGALAGRRVVVSAGPTFEDLDPVRFIGNRSSGRMGYAIAQAARAAGATVTLVSGPVALADPPGIAVQRVRSAQQMRDAVLAAVADADVYIGAAAVADYRPAALAAQKIKKDRDTFTVELVRNPDILSEVAALPRRPFTVGFAAETDDVLGYARRKLDDKRLDMIAANAVGAGLGFETDDNALTLLWPGGQRELPRASKAALARELIAVIAERLHARG
ncbi:bifunctional phosphopantothenoylcysteine decarboxylase/phosphopantothenate--cysteine ligase CoaBC [Immundisolibacter sp.]|uniref:bifunctional phosphopantothenoylcysteine decarboxylase/phosphopantothenate--cysteine ligase CoaBC n=1 Tax=Immundisolibacter sp. TaxID=1934948 RepID=UPI00263473CF|nr:bifunctional phosphopantothenoylcysteine decarboxylase/phosphopantothenate--cysteine ligase CoaBC [Immundisolibacter sp.]MDD3651535.1 bifunctional phosphopantothenoylcysteine decarboxylase/phosphopantothenate--cysteine ligase CoaBC [Immundisolibacter sp.]